MFLKDSAVLFVRRPSTEDPYLSVFDRYELYETMVFEKQAVGREEKNEGRCAIYFFPERSRVKGGAFPALRPGDWCAAGKCADGIDPLTDESGVCRRIVSVTEHTGGSGRVRHIVIEAI